MTSPEVIVCPLLIKVSNLAPDRRCILREFNDACTGLPTSSSPMGSSGFERFALGRNAFHQLVPGLRERSSSFNLELRPQRLNVNVGLGERGQHLIAFAGTRGDASVNLSMVG